jgi:DNA-binding beta-propeller fold protein YncE
MAALCMGAVALAAAAPAEAAPDDPIFVFNPGSVKPPPPFPAPEGPCGLAVDSVGNVYLSDYYHHLIDVFRPFASSLGLITQLKNVDPIDGPCGLALDEGGSLYVNNFHRNVEKFVPSSFPPVAATNLPLPAPATTYAPAGVFDSAHPTGVAVDPVTGVVYVNDRTHLAAYDSSGAPILDGGQPVRIGLGSLQDGYGLAISSLPTLATRLYVADAATDTVKVYDPALDTVDPVAVIDGHDTPGGAFVSLRDAALAVDWVTGEIYVADNLQPEYAERPETVIHVFDSSGAYEGRLKHSVVDGRPTGLAVDNSGTSTQSRVYVTSGNTEKAVVYAYPPAAATSVPATLGTTPPAAESSRSSNGPSSASADLAAPRATDPAAPTLAGPAAPSRPRHRARHRGRAKQGHGSGHRRHPAKRRERSASPHSGSPLSPSSPPPAR